MGARQFAQRPRNHSQVMSGRFKNHGMEYRQCGQCDGGETTLNSSGMRWMQTFRKLPTIAPKMKNTPVQKWKGTSAQFSGWKMAVIKSNSKSA